MSPSDARLPQPFPGPRDLSRALWLRVLAALMLVPGVAALGAGILMVLLDLSDTTDDWHGLGVFLGALLALPGAVLAATAVVVLQGVRGALAGPVQAARSRLVRLRAVLASIAAAVVVLAVGEAPALGSGVVVAGVLVVPVALGVALITGWISELTARSTVVAGERP